MGGKGDNGSVEKITRDSEVGIELWYTRSFGFIATENK